MKIANCRRDIFALVLTSLLILISFQVQAEAGRVVFVHGDVTAKGEDGVVRNLFKRDKVDAGDLIRTSSKSLVQIRMVDKGFIALRSNSTVRIESYSLGAKKEEDVGIFSLLKGGLRAVTGIIGKRLRSAYQMRTVNATIGVRGTDYTARLCNQDCDQGFGNVAGGKVADGLYVGVNIGGIDLTNDLGTLDLDQLQYGYVKDATSAPVALLSAPEFLHYNSSPPNPDDQPGSSDTNENIASVESTVASRSLIEPQSGDITSDDGIRSVLQIDQTEISQEQIEDSVETPIEAETASGTPVNLTGGVISSTRMVVSTYSQDPANEKPFVSIQANPYSSAVINDNNLQAFENSSIDQVVGKYTPGSATSVDLGYDPVSKVAWGRWYNGQVNFQPASGSLSNLDMSNSSLHWVAGPDQGPQFALPSGGTANFQLVGNTSPTDNLGNTGILGEATLSADFLNSKVDASIAVGINNQVWNGSASGLSLSRNNGTFSGNLNTVEVTTSSGVVSGAGNTAGFITNNGVGAGMGFSMEADISGTATTVNGTAIFQK